MAFIANRDALFQHLSTLMCACVCVCVCVQVRTLYGGKYWQEKICATALNW